jgi:hypothetical protein
MPNTNNWTNSFALDYIPQEHKGSTQTNKKIKERVQKERSKETQVCPGLAHRTVRCATGQCPVHQDRTTPNFSPLGFCGRTPL